MGTESAEQYIEDYMSEHEGLDVDFEAEEDSREYLKRVGSMLVEKLSEAMRCNQQELAEILGCTSETISRWKLQRTRASIESLLNMIALNRKMKELPTREAREKYKYAMLLLAKLQGRREIKDPLTGKRYPVEQRPPVDFVSDGTLEHLVDIWEKAIQDSVHSVDETISEVLGDRGISLEEASLDGEKLFEMLRQIDYEVQEEAEQIRRQKMRERLPDLLGGEETDIKKERGKNNE